LRFDCRVEIILKDLFMEILPAYLNRFIRKIRSEKILNKLGAGRTVYFENPVEEIAFRYIPEGFNKPGRYYAKYYGQTEYEIDSNSSSILMAVMEGRQISRSRYEQYHLTGGHYWNKKPPVTYRAAGF